MSKPSKRPTREARKEHKQKVRQAQRQLREHQAEQGLLPLAQISVSNRLCPYHDEAEEQAAREAAVAGQLGVFRTLLPKLLKDLSNIGDPRQAKKVKHKLTAVLLYGLLSFVFPDGFSAPSQSSAQPPGIFGHPESAVSGTGDAAACRYAASAVAENRCGEAGASACRADPAADPQ